MDNVSQEETGELLENQEGQEENLRKISLSWYVWKFKEEENDPGAINDKAMQGKLLKCRAVIWHKKSFLPRRRLQKSTLYSGELTLQS